MRNGRDILQLCFVTEPCEVQTGGRGGGDKPEPRGVGCAKETVCRENLEVQTELDLDSDAL